MTSGEVISSYIASDDRRLRSDVIIEKSTRSLSMVDRTRRTKRFALPVCARDRSSSNSNIAISTSVHALPVPFLISFRAFDVALVFVFLMTSSSPPFSLTSSFAAVSAQPAATSVWVSWPSDEYQLIGLNATFSCIIARNVSASDIFVWTAIDDDGTVANLFVNNVSIDSAPVTSRGSRYRAYYVTGGMQLVLSNIDRSDDARYQCQASNVASGAKQGRLTVVVDPAQPMVTLVTPASQSNLFENNVTQLSCASLGGNPAPNITWYRNGQSLPPSGVTWTPPAAKFGLTTSSLTRILTSDDNLANFSCLASSDVIRPFRISSQQVQLSVKYAPIVSLGPYTSIAVVEGSALTLTCSVDANPAVNSAAKWFKDASSLNVFSWTLSVINPRAKQDAGLYTCVASNFATRNSSVYVDVLYTPRLVPVSILGGVMLNGVFQVNEGAPLNVTFFVDSNPSPSPLDETSFRWYKDGTLVATGRYLTMATVSRRDAGNYVCNVTNAMIATGSSQATIGYGTGTITITVLYKPGNATIIGPQFAIVGDDVTMTCLLSDPGNPMATITWSGSSDVTQFPSGSALRLGVVSLTSIGTYTCQGTNGVGTGLAAGISLDIAEPPVWSAPLLPSQLVTMVNVTSSVLSVICSAYGRPAPVIKWTKNGQPLEAGFYDVTTYHSYYGYRTNVTSSVFWRGNSRTPSSTSLRPDDYGQYTCTLVSNLTMASMSQTVEVNVKYAPLMSTELVEVALDSGQSAQLICRCRAFPAPTFNWKSGPTMALPDIGSRTTTWIEPLAAYPFVGALNISRVQLSDLGIHSCTAFNSMGSAPTLFNVTVKTIPDRPSNLTVVSKSWESVGVVWQPSFDGGYSQEFYVSVSTLSRDSALRNSTGEQSAYNITGLFPSTWYSVFVSATNRIGESLPSNTVNIKTDGLLLTPPTSVFYNVDTRTLTFQNSVNPVAVFLSLRVTVSSSSSWQTLSPITPPSNSVSGGGGGVVLTDRVLQESRVQAVQAAFCVSWRPDVCSMTSNATITRNDDVPVVTIIAVVCVCGGVILILSIALTAICYRRRLARRKQNGSSSVANPASVISSPNGPYLQQAGDKTGSQQLPMRLVIGYDNPVLDQTDLSNKVFFEGLTYYSDDDIASEGGVVRPSPPPYDRQQHQLSGGSDSGVPDTPRPTRRVIYEVVV